MLGESTAQSPDRQRGQPVRVCPVRWSKGTGLTRKEMACFEEGLWAGFPERSPGGHRGCAGLSGGPSRGRQGPRKSVCQRECGGSPGAVSSAR